MPSLCIPSTAQSAGDVYNTSSASSRRPPSSTAHASSSAAAAARPATTPAASKSSAAQPAANAASDLSSVAAERTPSGSLLVQPLTRAMLSDLALQMQLPTGLQQAASPAAADRGTGTWGEAGPGGAEGGSGNLVEGKGRKRRKKSRRELAMAHIEEHLSILKHVHVKHASAR